MAERRNFKTRRRLGEASSSFAEQGIPARRQAALALTEETRGRPSWRDARPEKVAKARRLVQDKSYPSRQVLESVADLLAEHLQSER